MNPNIKFWLDYMMLAVQLASWMRFISFFLLFKSIANLLLTLMKMMTDAETFFYLAIMYLSIIVVVFMMIFQEICENYQGFMYSFRSLFDAFLGNYSNISSSSDFYTMHTITLILHILLGNIFLFNYLIAILATTYEENESMGEFAY
jgi:hypothetical protein